MSKRKFILKEAGGILIASLMVLSAIVVTANTTELTTSLNTAGLTTSHKTTTQPEGSDNTISDVVVTSDIKGVTVDHHRAPLRGGHFYAYNVYDSSGTFPIGPITFDTPGTITSLATGIAPNFISGADIDANGLWYGVDYQGGIYLIGFDGAMTFIANSIALNAMCYDSTSGTWYGASSDGNLYSIDVVTGASTVVGPIGNSLIVGLVCDNNGNMFGYNVSAPIPSTLYSFNKATGAATPVGSMGVNFNFAQDAAYDRDNNIMYIAGYITGGTSGLYTCDTSTGAVTLLGEFENDIEVDGFAIPWTPVREDVIFSQPPNQGQWSAYTSSSQYSYLCDDDFWGLTETINAVEWWGFQGIYSGGWSPGDPTGSVYDIKFYQDSGGTPGSVVADFPNLSPIIVDVGEWGWDVSHLFHFSVSLPESVNLAAGWLSIDNTYTPDSSVLLWVMSPIGNNNSLQNGNEIYGNLAFNLRHIGLLLYEHFDNGVPPLGWGTNYPNNWITGPLNNAGGTSPEAWFYWAPTSNDEHLLWTHPIDTTAYATYLLKFKEYVSDYNSDYTLKVVTSIDGGATWQDAYVRAGGPYGPTTTEVTLTAANGVGSATLQIAWDMSGDSFNINDWYIDDVAVTSVNTAPNTPSNPNPANHATGISITKDLSWTGGDPDAGDIITYNVYFGTTNPPPKVSTNQSSTTFDPGTLNFLTTYYWKIKAWDNHGASKAGPVWTFTTKQNQPPNKPKRPTGPAARLTGQAGTYWANGTDPDGDKIQYRFDWNASGSHSYSGWTSLVNSGTKLSKNHTWTVAGAYVVKVQSKDEYGATSTWSNGLNVTVVVNHAPNQPKKPTGQTTRLIGQTGTYWANGTDPDGDKIQYRFDWDASGAHSYSGWTSLVNSGQKLSKNHSWAVAGTYVVKVQSKDEHGLVSVWSNGLTVTVANHAPNKPKKPTGSTALNTGQQGTYWANGTDPDGDQIQYRFDWDAAGSHAYSAWTALVNSGTKLSKNHAWAIPGTYIVMVQSRDEHGAVSVWSTGLTIIVSA
jgi:hypothetical protein